LKAAVFGEIDPVTGVSANIMAGQPIRGGTAFSDILLDEVAVLRLQKDLPPAKPLDGDDDGPDENEINEALGDEYDDSCSNLQMNVVLPKAGAAIEEEGDIELVELA
jgi:hypothetical protein